MNTVYNCIVCNKTLSGKQRSYCSVACKNDHFLNYTAVKVRAQKRKDTLLGSRGGKCEKCGYTNDTDALSFYDKEGVSLRLNVNILANSNIHKLQDKVTNSKVLCRNCAAEVRGNKQDGTTLLKDREKQDYKNRKNVVIAVTSNFVENISSCGIDVDEPIALGVSGGIDSMVMLDLFRQNCPKNKLIIAHVNHGVREEANDDELFVQGLADKYNLTFHSKTLASHKDQNKRMSNNLEEYLRDERRSFLLLVAKESGAFCLALAHNADDQAETVIMNLVRGSGPSGLAAMKLFDNKIIRPLLDISREDIMIYALENKLRWHEDKTNTDTTYNRNYIRHQILPLLARLNPEYLANISRTSTILGDIDEYLKDRASWVTKQLQTNVAIARDIPKPVLYEAFGSMYEHVKGDRKNLSLAHLMAIESLSSDASGSKSLDLPGNIAVKRMYNHLDFVLKIEDNESPIPETIKLQIGTTVWSDWTIVVDSKVTTKSSVGNYILTTNDLDLVVRTVKPGDRIAAKGLSGHKKLQDLFVNAKIDKELRKTWPVVANMNNEVVWVPGLAISEPGRDKRYKYTIKIDKDKYENSKEK